MVRRCVTRFTVNAGRLRAAFTALVYQVDASPPVLTSGRGAVAEAVAAIGEAAAAPSTLKASRPIRADSSLTNTCPTPGDTCLAPCSAARAGTSVRSGRVTGRPGVTNCISAGRRTRAPFGARVLGVKAGSRYVRDYGDTGPVSVRPTVRAGLVARSGCPESVRPLV